MNRHQSLARSPQRPAWLILLVVLAAVGCGKPENNGKVSGTVTYQGKPLPIGTVSFLDSSNQWLCSSIIRKGKYVMPVKAPVGTVKVTVTSQGGLPISSKGKSDAPPASVPDIPAKYGNPDQSGLTYTVQPGQNTFNIELQ